MCVLQQAQSKRSVVCMWHAPGSRRLRMTQDTPPPINTSVAPAARLMHVRLPTVCCENTRMHLHRYSGLVVGCGLPIERVQSLGPLRVGRESQLVHLLDLVVGIFDVRAVLHAQHPTQRGAPAVSFQVHEVDHPIIQLRLGHQQVLLIGHRGVDRPKQRERVVRNLYPSHCPLTPTQLGIGLVVLRVRGRGLRDDSLVLELSQRAEPRAPPLPLLPLRRRDIPNGTIVCPSAQEAVDAVGREPRSAATSAHL
mmetsp:Transcript_13067/g.25029  ORF Transcript_13067/g.25029 Transcript_13067/m.25029 type:complete len:252 (-) Transcript_13067:885-1640(-)